MAGLKRIVANSLKYTGFYQRRRAKNYYLDSEDKYSALSEDEKPVTKGFVRNFGNKTDQIVRMMRNVRIKIRCGNRFQVWIDTGVYVGAFYSMIDNNTPYYPIILDNSIDELIDSYHHHKGKYYDNQIVLLQGVKEYINRVISEIDRHIANNSNDIYLEKTRAIFLNMISGKAESLEEALQRILFWSSLFWQSQHLLVGLGRLDKILEKYSVESVNTVDIITDFYNEMHRYYAFKSSKTSLGDTGQIIVLGGLEQDGSYFCNSLTYDFVRTLEKCHLPDPKILLRVSKNMPDDLLHLALNCIGTGIGCPLFANDDVIIPALESFGYTREDAFNYITSACWEPLVYGDSLEKNNIKIINYAEPLTQMIKGGKFGTEASFEAVLSDYMQELDYHVDDIKNTLKQIQWEPDPLMSLLTISCYINGKDISEGGSKYRDYGVLTLGMTNAVNSLLNIKKMVFENKKYSLLQLKEAIHADYNGFYEIEHDLRNSAYFGKDNDEVISMVNMISKRVEDNLEQFSNRFGGRVKFGLSSSNYVEASSKTIATLDGRKSGEPLRAHITCAQGEAYTELINFASQINYNGLKTNGNVVDFIVSPAFMKKNHDKFFVFIKQAIRKGFFEMQMNVVNSDTLIRAKKDPEKYPDLIVRVWGFSAYFKDLPEEYQDVLIKRTLESESVA